MTARRDAYPGYEALASVLDEALMQAQSGKGFDRHARPAQSFVDQLIVALCMELGSNHGDIFQACKKAIESTRLDDERAIAELLGAINYLAAAVIVRRNLAARSPAAPAAQAKADVHPSPFRPLPIRDPERWKRIVRDSEKLAGALFKFEWFISAIAKDQPGTPLVSDLPSIVVWVDRKIAAADAARREATETLRELGATGWPSEAFEFVWKDVER